MAKARILVVVNKWWECDPLMSVLVNATAQRPSQALRPPQWVQPPRPRPDPGHLPGENPCPVARAIFALSNVTIEIWCISDLLEHLSADFQSSSEKKANLLPKL